MSEWYYRRVNEIIDSVKLRFPLSAILLKLNEHNLNIKNNYDICIANKNSLIDINKKFTL